MTLLEQLKELAACSDDICVSISLNTHRTHPDTEKDIVELKNLLKEAEQRLLKEYGKREIKDLLEKLVSVQENLDPRYFLDSLHIFLSASQQQIFRSGWPVAANRVEIGPGFALRDLIKTYNRQTEYLILLLSQSGVSVYDALNDNIRDEIRNADFPISENLHYNTFPDKGSDPNHLDNLVREYLNKVDKALMRLHLETGLPVVVVCTEDNYSRLMQVADRPSVYIGYAPINYNAVAPHEIVTQAWPIMEKSLEVARRKALEELKEAIGAGKVITDLQEIYRASIDGRGELLIVQSNYQQPVMMKDERHFEILENDQSTKPGAIDDIVSTIAWNTISSKGRVVFTKQEGIPSPGNIALLLRY